MHEELNDGTDRRPRDPASRPTRRQILAGLPAALAVPGLAISAIVSPTDSVSAQGRTDGARFLAAVVAGRDHEVAALLDRDSDLVHSLDEIGRSAFALALIHRHPEIADLLRDRGHRPDLHEAALAGDWERMKELANEDPAQVNHNHPIGGTAFYAAAMGGAGSQIFHPYSYAGDPNRVPPRSSGITPLRVALEHPDLATAEMTAAGLLANGADPNLPQSDGVSPLHLTAERGSVDLTEMLVRKGAHPAARDRDGQTPLDRAQGAWMVSTMTLLERQADIPRDHSTSRRANDIEGRPYEAPDLSVFSPLARGEVVGLSHFNFEEVRARVDRYPPLAHSVATTTEGAVEACAHTGRAEIVNYLLEKGAPYSLPTAVMRGDLDRARALLTEDPLRIHERGPHDFPLFWYPVIGGGNLEMAQLLIDAGAEIERQHHLGTTALHFAARGGQLETSAWLVDHGAEVDRIGRKFDAAGQTPLALARQREHQEVADLLLARGARE